MSSRPITESEPTMSRVETKVTISVNPEGMSPEELEKEIGQVLQQAGRLLLQQAC